MPLDLRMAPSAIEKIAARAEPRRLVLGSGRDAPDPAEAGLTSYPTSSLEALTADPDTSFPADWEAQARSWQRPAPDEIFELVFTSGTTGTPKGVMLAHDNVLASIGAMHKVIPPIEHRIVSLLPLSHLFEQAVSLLYALDVGASILYVRSRNPRTIFEAIRDHRTTSMVVVPQILELFWTAIEREVEKSGRATAFDRLRRIARRLPYSARRWLFRSVHSRLGGSFRLFVSSGAFLPPAVQQAWEDMGIVVIQGYGATETGFGACQTISDHKAGTVGRPMPPVRMRLAEDGEVQFAGPTLFKSGRLILMGRTKDMIVLPNGFNVYPEDIENALRVAGVRDSVVVETRPGRIEAVVLAPAGHDLDRLEAAARQEALHERIEPLVKQANATLGINQRLSGWRLWPHDDFPRTHTFKVKRNEVRAWVGGTQPAPTAEAATTQDRTAEEVAAG